MLVRHALQHSLAVFLHRRQPLLLRFLGLSQLVLELSLTTHEIRLHLFQAGIALCFLFRQLVRRPLKGELRLLPFAFSLELISLRLLPRASELLLALKREGSPLRLETGSLLVALGNAVSERLLERLGRSLLLGDELALLLGE